MTPSPLPPGPRYLMPVKQDLRDERGEKFGEKVKTVRSAARSVYMWISWALMLSIVTTYELGVTGQLFVAIFGGSEYKDLARDNPQEAQRLIDQINQDRRFGLLAFSVLAVLLLSVIGQLVGALRFKAPMTTVDVALVCIIAAGLLSLLLDNLGVIHYPSLRPAAVLVVIIAFVIWEGPKVVGRVRSAFR
jgi:hypothetical protein